MAAKKQFGADGFVTTEKDAVNLGPLGDELAPLAVARLRVTFENADDIIDTILARIGK